MTLPIYASPEQLMRERSELARKGIARGRSVVVMTYAGGVLFVAENPSSTLHKVSEIYDKIGFAAVGRYSEFESLRRAGIRYVDLQGYNYDPRDVSARQLANVYAQTLGTIFIDQLKPFEVEVCVAEVGAAYGDDQVYRLTYDGSIVDEPRHVVMGGQAETISTALKELYSEGLELVDAVRTAVKALNSITPPTTAAAIAAAATAAAQPAASKLEVAVLERGRPRRAFRRISGAALTALLPDAGEPASPAETPKDNGSGPAKDNGSGSGDPAGN